jgi:hypothetical protein
MRGILPMNNTLQHPAIHAVSQPDRLSAGGDRLVNRTQSGVNLVSNACEKVLT